ELDALRGELLHGHPDRVPGAVLLLLDRGGDLRGRLLQVLGDLLPAVPHDDDGPLGLQLAGGGEHMAEHGPPAELVEDLGKPGLHTGALARREDDDGSRAAHAHWRRLLMSLADGCKSRTRRAEARIGPGPRRRRDRADATGRARRSAEATRRRSTSVHRHAGTGAAQGPTWEGYMRPSGFHGPVHAPVDGGAGRGSRASRTGPRGAAGPSGAHRRAGARRTPGAAPAV